jgi:tetratricopeptide (TPR) repeat protein
MEEMIDRATMGRESADEPPASLQAVVSRGTVLKRMGRLPEAANVLRAGIARFPDADDLAQEYAWISHEVGDYAFGTVHWRHLRAHAPTNLDGYLGGGLASRSAGAFEAADRIYEQGIERFPDNATLQIDYAWSAEERQDFVEAVRRWTLVRERFPDLPEGVIRPGLVLLAAGRLAEAETALAEAVERYPDNVEALTEHAFVAQLQGRWPVALARWERVIMRYPELPLPRRFCAAALLELGRYREAETVLAPALRMFPDDLELVVTQAWIATRGRTDLRAAAELWETVRSRAAERLEGYHGAAAALIEAGRLDEADELLNTAVERFPAEVAAAMEWARLPERRENWTLAATRWETVVARFPNNPESYAGLGNVLMLGSRLAEAQMLLKAAGAQFPNDVEIAAAAARVAERGADWPQALIRWKAVQTRFPEVAIGYAGYGRSLREFGELVGATSQLREALSRFPEDLELSIELAVTLGAQRDWPQALAAWDALKRRHPGNRVVAGYITNVLGLALADQALAGSEAFTIPPALLEASNVIEVPTTDQAAILKRFESLGDSCEFAMVQRLYDVEHLSLLRWARTSPEDLVRALDARFDGVGDPEHTVITQIKGEYITEDRRYGMRAHTFTSPTAEPLEEFAPEQCRRIQWLKGRLLTQLTAAGKIFVYTAEDRVTPAQAVALFEALQRYSERNTLLCVRAALPDHPPGSLEELRPGLWMGYLDKLSTVDISVDLWLTLCRAVVERVPRLN